MDERIKEGAVITIAHPFVRDTVDLCDGEDFYKKDTWVPGVRHEACGQYGENSEAVADGIGAQTLTIVSIHKPGKFPTRVFYTRLWRDPDGREFGKGKLHIKTAQAFGWIIRGYRVEFYMAEPSARLAS
jgi:hypothetical protein